MVTLAGYKNLIPIHNSINSQIYRAQRVDDKEPVILKFLNQDYPTTEQIRRYKQEYHLTCQLKSPGIIKAYSLVEWQRSFAIIFEDFGGISLQEFLREQEKLSLEEFLFLAIAITESLGQIHTSHIIHKDINPANIIFNPETKELKIIDFGISTQLSRENPTLKNPNILEGTLAYISPEQTGRMNRSLDYRTDFYSLGVTFYEMLTQKLPFSTLDPLELIHSHLAKQAIYPSKINSSIPPIISDIVIKLMAKNAEDRYQSGWGLKADLEKCLQQLELTGKSEVFPLGNQDFSVRFQIPQKLYGRETEIATLLTTFERVAESGKVELMMVAGYSGIGKSSLVQELYKPITASRGYFISGKFDQFQKNIPYSAVVAAFGGLIRQLLGESEAQLQLWRKKLLTALGSNGQVIIDVIPEVELVIGKQPPVTELGPNESQNRFNRVFSQFIRVFCTKEHPLVIFLDDLQWADSATLKLIELMMTDQETQYLFLIGAYRDNEVSQVHPLMITLDGLKKEGIIVNFITLATLNLDSISQLISDTLNSNINRVKPLAKLVKQKTGGNPFFTNQFLTTLYSENLILSDLSQTGENENKDSFWQWDINKIKSQNITDNVVELMVKKLKKLPETTQQVLRLAACIGANFDLTTISIVCEKSKEKIFPDLLRAIQAGLILPTSELDVELLIQDYKFLHDRVQQAAYALIDEAQKTAVHLKIGQLLLQNTEPETLSEQIFEIVDHLNLGIDLVTEQNERDRIAKLNLMAGKKAKSATAYTASVTYFQLGREVLSTDCWQNSYDLALSLYEEAAESCYLCGDFTTMHELIEVVKNSARTIVEKVKVYDVEIQAASSQGEPRQSLEIGLNVLEKLGFPLPKNPTDLDVQKGLHETASLLKGRKIAELIDLPEMTSPEPLAAMFILGSTLAAAYISNSRLFVLNSCLQVNLSIKYGNAMSSAFGYSCYATNLCWIAPQDIESGYEFGKLALNLRERLNADKIKAKVFQMWGDHIMHWKEHFSKTLPIVFEGYQSGIETGDFEFASYCACYVCNHAYFIGRELTELEEQMVIYSNAITKIRRDTAFHWNAIFWQAVLNLLGRSENPVRLVGDAFNEEKPLPDQDKTRFHFLYFNKLILCYLFEEKHEAVKNAVAAEEYLDGVKAMIVESPFNFYDSLAHLSIFQDLSNSEKQALLDRVDKNQKKMGLWAYHAPMNHQHKFDLVEAEKCRVLGKKAEAIEFYNQAIQGAKENKYIQEEALANELCAKFYLNWSQEKVARVYMTDAHYCYSLWGAKAKVKHLEENYPQLLQSSTITSPSSKIFNVHVTKSSTTPGKELDLATVIKSTNAISCEIVLENLLATLMNILVENAGARRGILILPKGKHLFVEATKEPEMQEISVLQSIPLEQFEKLSEKIVRYVARTRKTVVLKNAAIEGNFTDDAYIQQYQCQSIACTPLISQNQLQGIMYLENNLSAGAFTQERLELLRTLATQGAISLENARLYDAYKRFVPNQFLSFLEKKSIIDVELGNQVEREMTVMFSDIRGFTSISEQMTPAENFAFINEYLGYMEPQIKKHGGFIDKYIGDAIMALFPNSADDALKGAIAMLEELKIYNQVRQERNLDPLRIGIGLHTGRLILGTVGGLGRMDGTVIGDAVNLSSRVEGLTKTYGVSLLITHQTLAQLNNPVEYDLRFVEQVKAKGKAKAVGLFEVFSADPPELRDAKRATKEKFERAVVLFYQKSFVEAGRLFEECVAEKGGDRTASSYLERCQDYFI